MGPFVAAAGLNTCQRRKHISLAVLTHPFSVQDCSQPSLQTNTFRNICQGGQGVLQTSPALIDWDQPLTESTTYLNSNLIHLFTP